jgi:hypothetical protein
MVNLFKDKLKQFLGQNRTFDKKELWNFYTNIENKYSEQGFFWYLYDLQEEKVIKAIDKDTYQFVNSRLIFSPKIDAFLQEICQNLLSRFELNEYCIWSSEWLNEFAIHQSMRNLILLEVEKEVAEAIFYALKDMNYTNVFLLLQKADEAIIERYIFEAQNPIVISKIITKSPVKKLDNGVIIPKLEKILVDVFCDESLLVAYKGHERDTIFRNVLKKYDISLKTIFAYARRRRKEEQLRAYLYQNFQSEIESLL